MPTNVNSAFRVHALFRAASQQPDVQKTYEIWATLLGVSSDRRRVPEVVARVTDRLTLAQKELERVRQQMAATGRSPDLYVKYLNKAEQALGLGNLTAIWGNYRKYIDEATLNALQWCSETLPDEERLLEDEDLETIRSLVSELRQALEAESVPEELRRLLSTLLDIVESALAEYPVSGAQAFERAFVNVTLTMQDAADVVERHRDRQEVGEFRRLLEALDEVVGESERYGSMVGKAIRAGAWLLEHGRSLLPPG